MDDFVYKKIEKNHAELGLCHLNGDIVWLELSVCNDYRGKKIGLLYNTALLTKSVGTISQPYHNN